MTPTDPQQPIEISDCRRKSFYISDNNLIDLAGPLIGPIGGSVYNSLLRHSDRNGQSFPSIDLIAREWGISKPPVIKAIALLVKHNMVEVIKESGKKNHYKVLDQSLWNIPSHKNLTSKPRLPVDDETSKPRLPVDDETSKPRLPVDDETSKRRLPLPVNDVYPKNTHITIPSTLGLSGVREVFFEAFWNTWPKEKRRHKGDAEEAWKQIKPDKPMTEYILRAIERAKQSKDWTKEEGRFIPYPAKWLKAKGYDDEYPDDPAEQKHEGFYTIDRDGNKRRPNGELFV
jgi:hypothetical protein